MSIQIFNNNLAREPLSGFYYNKFKFINKKMEMENQDQINSSSSTNPSNDSAKQGYTQA